MQIVYSIHNFGLERVGTQAIVHKLDADIVECAADPLHRNIFVVGDMNGSANPGETFNYANPDLSSLDSGLLERRAGAESGALSAVLAKLTEIEARTPTRYNTVSDCGVILDRIFTSLPSFFQHCK